jgi:hypothetical protein
MNQALFVKQRPVLLSQVVSAGSPALFNRKVDLL